MATMRDGKLVSRKELRAEVDALLTRTKAAVAKRKPKASVSVAKPAPKPAPSAVAKPAAPAPKPTSRSARLRDAEGQVKAAKPRDHRLCWSDMSTK
jgi:hypothetical protein